MNDILKFLFRTTPEQFEILAEEVVLHFPEERKETYYHRSKKPPKATGKLLEHHYYISGVLKKDSALQVAEVREDFRRESFGQELQLNVEGNILFEKYVKTNKFF